ncbi:hypothetical protein ABZX93_11795 [Streptomyces sp. NPDC006632]|uniref:hypothetical protein n=1 Tax=Streptomyces sp. NPDC006632 TaxID=3157182 RepID=UPI0033A0464C
MGGTPTTGADIPEPDTTHRYTFHSWQLVAAGCLLGAIAFWERWQGARTGRRYTLCHHSAHLDHLTLTALALVAAAPVVSIACAIVADSRGAVASRRLVAGCLVTVLALLVAADTVDAAGERQAQRLTVAEPFDGAVCDYAPQDYTATPGWFAW